MNREELAMLLAQTHGQISHSSQLDRPPGPVPRSPAAVRLRNPSSPLSPRQLFQCQVRTLSDDEGVPQARSTPSPGHKGRDLQHLSSLRVHVRSKTPTSPRWNSRRKHDYSARDGRFSFTAADPDFVVEERAAWDSEAPDEGPHVSTGQGTADDNNNAYNATLADADSSSPPQSLQNHAALMQFGPSSTSTRSHDRPSTSRGQGLGMSSMPGTFPETNYQQNARDARRSKFNEGTMSERSTAVSSTWDDYGPRLSESSADRSADDTDSDATPRGPSRLSRDSDSSFDVSEFQPRATTPSTIKNRLSKLGSHFKSTSEESEIVGNDQKKEKRKGLRKSISNWNFHTFGEKMRFFGSSTQELGDSPIKKQQNAEALLTNDRKRKAEEAYAQQFGTKKQKSNDRIPVDDKRSSSRTQPRTSRQRSASAQRTITQSTVHRRREASPARAQQPVDPAEILSDGDIDRRKRATRRELEKENQQLRAILREQQQQKSIGVARSASKSTVHLPLSDQHSLLASEPSKSSALGVHKSGGGSTVRKQQKQHDSQGIPPVPPMPNKGVFANLGTGNVNHRRNGSAGSSTQSDQLRSHFGAAETGTIKRVGAGVLRPVSTILEGDENSPAEGNNASSLELGVLPGSQALPRKADWQWPEDVF